MNTERLYEFQVLAQTLHYGEAASKLYISQSILSRHIQSLENELGIMLFQRSSHNVSLTAAGAAFYRLSKDFLKDVSRAAETARIAGLGLSGSVQIAILLPTMSSRFKDFLCRFEEKYPEIFIGADIVSNIVPDDLSKYDFLTLPSAAIRLSEEFEVDQVFPEEGCLAVPEGNWVIPGQPISLASLADETLFLPGYNRRAGAYARIGHLARRVTNDHIRIVSVPTPETALLNVEMNRGFTIIPRYRTNTFSTQIRYTPVQEDCHFELFLMKNKNSASQAAELFRKEFARVMFEKE